MPNGLPMNRPEQESLVALQTRVHHLEQGLVGISKDVREGFAQSAKQISELASRFEQDRRPQWQAYGVMVTVVVVLGGLVYWPIREQSYRIEAAVVKMTDDKIGRAEFAATQEQSKETRAHINSDITRADAYLQRQLDELKKQAADTYSMRDVLLELKQNQKELQGVAQRARAGAP